MLSSRPCVASGLPRSNPHRCAIENMGCPFTIQGQPILFDERCVGPLSVAIWPLIGDTCHITITKGLNYSHAIKTQY